MLFPDPAYHDARAIPHEAEFSALLADIWMYDKVQQTLAGAPLLADLHRLMFLTSNLDADLETLHSSITNAQLLHDQLALKAAQLSNRQHAMHVLQTEIFFRLGGGAHLAPFSPDTHNGNDADVSDEGRDSDSDQSYYTPPIAQLSPTNTEPIPIPPLPTSFHTARSEPVPSTDLRPRPALRRVSFAGLPSPVVNAPTATVSASELAHSDSHSDPPNPYEWYPAGDTPGNPINVDRLDEEEQPCIRCGRVGHTAEQCPRAWELFNVPRNVCSRCMQRGHWFRNCPQYRCRQCLCHAPGHTSAECPHSPCYSLSVGPSSPPRAGPSSRPY